MIKREWSVKTFFTSTLYLSKIEKKQPKKQQKKKNPHASTSYLIHPVYFLLVTSRSIADYATMQLRDVTIATRARGKRYLTR